MTRKAPDPGRPGTARWTLLLCAVVMTALGVVGCVNALQERDLARDGVVTVGAVTEVDGRGRSQGFRRGHDDVLTSTGARPRSACAPSSGRLFMSISLGA